MLNIRHDYLVLLTAIICGIIFVLPHILSPFLRGDDLYTPLVVKGVNGVTLDEVMYASNIRDVYDGHFIVKDSQLFEHKQDSTAVTPWLPYLLLGLMTKVTGSVPNTFIVSDFIFPALTFLVIYLFLIKSTRNFLPSFLGAVGVLFVSHLFTLSSIGPYLESIVPFNVVKLPYYTARLPFTELTFLLLVTGIYFTYLSIETGKKRYALLAGLFGGLQFYSYIYNIVGFSVGIGILFLLFLIRRNLSGLRQVILIGVVMLVIAVPYLIELLQISSTVDYIDILSRSGIYYGRFNMLLFIRSVFYAVLPILSLILIKRKPNYFLVLFSFFLAGIIGLNIQTVVGYTIQPNHYWLVILQPLGILLAAVLLNEVLNRNFNSFSPFNKLINPVAGFLIKNSKPLVGLLIISLLIHGAWMNASYAMNTYVDFNLTESQREIFEWLNQNTNKDDVVLSLSTETNLLLPVYTHNNVFLPNGLVSVSPTEETLDRIVIAYKLYDVDVRYLEHLLENKYLNTSLVYHVSANPESFESVFWSVYLFHFKYQIRLDMPKEAYLEEIGNVTLDQNSIRYMVYIPSDLRNKILIDFVNKSNDVETLLEKYRIDYVVIGTHEKSITNRVFSKHFSGVWSNSNTIVYKVN